MARATHGADTRRQSKECLRHSPALAPGTRGALAIRTNLQPYARHELGYGSHELQGQQAGAAIETMCAVRPTDDMASSMGEELERRALLLGRVPKDKSPTRERPRQTRRPLTISTSRALWPADNGRICGALDFLRLQPFAADSSTSLPATRWQAL